MRLLILCAIVMVAFAANSVLTRAGVALSGLDAVVFGVIRLVAGAAALLALCALQSREVVWRGPGRRTGVFGLLLYMFAFSAAYIQLDSGLGALLLFGTVQVTMFAAGLISGERVPALRWLGAGLAFAGLAWLMWPGPNSLVSPLHGVLMAIAGVGWGLYSLAGRTAKDPLSATAANFALATPLALVPLAFVWITQAPELPVAGVVLAIVCGAITSGLGYALWYSVLPKLERSAAAVAQLTVPVIAMLGGMLFLAEPLTRQFALASIVVLGGVALSLRAR